MAKEKHPTLFVFEGSVRCYEDGSMAELRLQVTNEEWETIVEETIKYRIFVECLKTTAIPLLEEERWDDEDEYFRLQLGVAVSRIRNIDSLLVAKFDQNKIQDDYISTIKSGAVDVKNLIADVKAQRRKELLERYDTPDDEDEEIAVVSDL